MKFIFTMVDTSSQGASLLLDSNNNNNTMNNTLPPDMTFGEAQIISISVYTPLFILSAFLNLRVLGKLLKAKERAGLSRLNQLLLHLVLGDLLVSSFYQVRSVLGSRQSCYR